jgi:hypothetical protein
MSSPLAWHRFQGNYYRLVHQRSLKRPYPCKPSRWLSIAWVHPSHGKQTYLHWSTTLFIEIAWLVLLNMMEICKIRTICWARRRNFLYLWKNIILLCWVRYLQIFVQFAHFFCHSARGLLENFQIVFIHRSKVAKLDEQKVPFIEVIFHESSLPL